MATAKQFELLFQLTARLGPNFSKSFRSASKTMNALQDDLRNADRKLKDVSAYEKQQAGAAKSRQEVGRLQQEHERLTGEIRKTGQATPKLTRELQKNEGALQKARDAAAGEEEKLQELSDTLRKAGINTDNLGKDTKELRQQYEHLKQSQKKVQEITEKQTENSRKISGTKAKLGGLIGAVTAVGTAIYAGPVKNAMRWQQEMQNVATLLDGDVKGRVSELNGEVMKLSNSTGIGTSDLTDGLYQVVSAFGDSADASKQLSIAARAAKAGNATTTDSINLLSAVTKGYGDTSAGAQQKAADLAFETVKLGQTSFPELASSMGQVIPLAATLRTKQEDLFGAMATLTGVTGSTAEVTTQLKATMQAFLSPSSSMQKSLERLGYASGKEMLESEGLQGALEKLKGSVNDDELAFAGLFSSVESKSAVLALTGKQAADFTEKTKQMYGAAGAAEAAFITSMDTNWARMEKAKTNITNLANVLGGVFMPGVGKAAEKVAGLADRLSEFAQKNPEVISTVAKVAAGLVGLKAGLLVARLGILQVSGGILAMQNALVTIRALKITKYLGTMGRGFGAVFKKIAPLAGVIAAVGGAVYYVSTHLEQVRGFIQKTFGDEGLAVFDRLWETITEVGTAVKNAFFISGAGVLDTLKSALPQIIGTLQSGLLPLLPVIADMFMQILPLIGQLVTAILPVLLGVLPVFEQLVSAIVLVLVQIVQAVLPVIIGLIQTLLHIIGQIIETVLPVFIGLLNTVLPIFQDIIQAILPVLTSLLQSLVPVIQLVARIFAGVLGSQLQSIADIVKNVMKVFQGLTDFISGVFTGNWSKAWEGIRSIFSGAVGGLGEIIKAPLRAVVAAVNTVIGGLNTLKVPDWVPGIGGKSIRIPKIPEFARGTSRTPRTFVAGEAGPELITDAAGRKVFTAAQTGKIFNNIARAENLNAADSVRAAAGSAGTVIIKVTNSPSVTVAAGGDTGGIKEQLQQYDEEFLEKLREIIRTVIREQGEQEARVAYA